MKKKKTIRQQSKYPALDNKLNIKARQEILEVDYKDQLPETWTDPITGKKYNPKQYLNDFLEEYANASFGEEKTRIHKKKKVPDPKNKSLNEIKLKLLKLTKDINEMINNSLITVKTKNNLRKAVGKFKKSYKKIITQSMSDIKDYYKKESEYRNNQRNADILTKARSQGKTVAYETLPESYHIKTNFEDEMIDRIDELKLAEEFEESGNESEDS